MSMLIALLGVGFGLIQIINRPADASQALLALPQGDTTSNTLVAASIGQATAIGPVASTTSGLVTLPAQREIVSSAKVIDANYTIVQGDTLGKIATRFNTSVERVQAMNNLADPRALRIGAKLVIPPPL